MKASHTFRIYDLVMTRLDKFASHISFLISFHRFNTSLTFHTHALESNVKKECALAYHALLRSVNPTLFPLNARPSFLFFLYVNIQQTPSLSFPYICLTKFNHCDCIHSDKSCPRSLRSSYQLIIIIRKSLLLSCHTHTISSIHIFLSSLFLM